MLARDALNAFSMFAPKSSIALAVIGLAGVMFGCRHTESSVGQRARAPRPLAVVAFAEVVDDPAPRDVRLWSLATDQRIAVRPPSLILTAERAQPERPAFFAISSNGSIVESFAAGDLYLRLDFGDPDARRLAQWSTNHQGRTIAVILGAGVVDVVDLQSPLPGDMFLVPLGRLSIPQQLWVIECLTGEVLTSDALRRMEFSPARE